MPSQPIHLVVLNYNGRKLLEECLPSVERAAAASRHACQVVVIDNDSTDDSVAYLTTKFPGVTLFRRPNLGLCSYNGALAELAGPVAVLLNNDVKLAAGCIDPLVAPLLEPAPPSEPGQRSQPACFMTASLCWRFDGVTYDGQKTAVGWRWGLVQATSLFEGHESQIHRPGWTASAGAVVAVDREKFIELGGFDPLYLPGRLEDLDFAYRGYQAGYHARYVPESVAWHLGMGSFAEAFGRAGCDALALRNTLLFQWKNLRHPLHVARQLLGLPLRLVFDAARSMHAERESRFPLWRAVRAARTRLAALPRAGQGNDPCSRSPRSWRRERDFFRRFSPRRMRAAA